MNTKLTAQMPNITSYRGRNISSITLETGKGQQGEKESHGLDRGILGCQMENREGGHRS